MATQQPTGIPSKGKTREQRREERRELAKDWKPNEEQLARMKKARG